MTQLIHNSTHFSRLTELSELGGPFRGTEGHHVDGGSTPSRDPIDALSNNKDPKPKAEDQRSEMFTDVDAVELAESRTKLAEAAKKLAETGKRVRELEVCCASRQVACRNTESVNVCLYRRGRGMQSE